MPKVMVRKSALKHVKTYLRSTMRNSQLHTLMLVHVDNILDNINLAAVVNRFFDRKERHKQTFRHLSQNYLLEL